MLPVPGDLMHLVCGQWVAPVRHCPKWRAGLQESNGEFAAVYSLDPHTRSTPMERFLGLRSGCGMGDLMVEMSVSIRMGPFLLLLERRRSFSMLSKNQVTSSDSSVVRVEP